MDEETKLPDSASNTVPLHRLRIYNPGRMTDREIELTFVARLDVFQRIASDLQAERPRSRPQHHLIVGQRGMGKTTLLLRIAAELRSAAFREKFIPLVFAEEQYSVDRLSKFWLNCLDSLADSCEREGNVTIAEQIDDIVAKLERSKGPTVEKDAAAAKAGLEAFLKIAKALGRRPVLLVDNLQLVFEKTADQQHDLRDVLTSPGAPILVAASPQLPPEANEYGFAFYDHFKTHYLQSLTSEAMREVMLSLAQRAGRSDIRQHILQHPGRLKALHQLTGGNPRTTVLLFHLYAEDCSPSVSEDLEKLLDDVTALYKARFEELAEQQQVIVSEMAEHWDPVTSRVLAEHAGLTPGALSSQLDRLQKSGFVEEVELFGTKKNGYQIAERFFNVWFLMRHASRRQRRQITFLTRFLESFYQPAEREQVARRWMRAGQGSTDRVLMSMAVADSLGDSALSKDLRRYAELGALEQKRIDASKRVERLIDFSQIPNKVIEFDTLRTNLQDKFGDELGLKIVGDLRYFLSGKRNQLAAGDFDAMQVSAIEQEVAANASLLREDFYSSDAIAWLTERLVRGELCDATDLEEWSQTIQACETPHQAEIVTDNLPDRICPLLNEEEQSHLFQLVSELDRSSATQWYNQGWRLHTKLCQYDWAEAAYRNAIEIDPNDADAWCGLGNLLQEHFNRYEESEVAYRKAIEIDPNDSYPLNGLGNLLFDSLGKYPEAIEAYDRAISVSPSDTFASLNLVFLKRDFQGNSTSARRFFEDTKEAIFQHRENIDTWHVHAALFAIYDQDWEKASRSLAEAVQIIGNALPPTTTDDWIRTAAVLLHLEAGTWFCEQLQSHGCDQSLRPFFEAIQAHLAGDRQRLLNVAVEVRKPAEWFFDQIEKRLKLLKKAKAERES